MDLFLVDDNNPGLYRTNLGRMTTKLFFYARQSDTKWMNEWILINVILFHHQKHHSKRKWNVFSFDNATILTGCFLKDLDEAHSQETFSLIFPISIPQYQSVNRHRLSVPQPYKVWIVDHYSTLNRLQPVTISLEFKCFYLEYIIILVVSFWGFMKY